MPLLRECLRIREQKEPDDWRTFNAKSMLGASLLGQEKYAEAEPLLLSGYEGMKQREEMIPPQGKARLTEAIERLVQLYERRATRTRPTSGARSCPWRNQRSPLRRNKTEAPRGLRGARQQAAGEVEPRSKTPTGHSRPGRSVCAPGALALLSIGKPDFHNRIQIMWFSSRKTRPEARSPASFADTSHARAWTTSRTGPCSPRSGPSASEARTRTRARTSRPSRPDSPTPDRSTWPDFSAPRPISTPARPAPRTSARSQ